jgi:hypothetical protein
MRGLFVWKDNIPTWARNETMKTKIALFLLLVLILPGCKSISQNTTNTEASKLRQGWDRINANDQFIFYLPQNMPKQDTHGIDSHVEEYRNKNMRVSFDYGIYSDPLDGYSMEPEYKEIKEVISGREVKIVYFKPTSFASEYKYFAGVHFPYVEESGIKLTMIAEFNDEKDWEIAQTIFRWIYFE